MTDRGPKEFNPKASSSNKNSCPVSHRERPIARIWASVNKEDNINSVVAVVVTIVEIDSQDPKE